MIDYIPRTRAYYAALGFDAYQWAANADIPFHRIEPDAPLELALITTAAPYQPERGDQGPGAAYNAGAKFFDVYRVACEPAPDLRISHIGYDRSHCRADDPNTWLPLRALDAARRLGDFDRLAADLIGVPTNRSQRRTMEVDAPAALAACKDIGANAALLVPT